MISTTKNTLSNIQSKCNDKIKNLEEKWNKAKYYLTKEINENKKARKLKLNINEHIAELNTTMENRFSHNENKLIQLVNSIKNIKRKRVEDILSQEETTNLYQEQMDAQTSQMDELRDEINRKDTLILKLQKKEKEASLYLEKRRKFIREQMVKYSIRIEDCQELVKTKFGNLIGIITSFSKRLKLCKNIIHKKDMEIKSKNDLIYLFKENIPKIFNFDKLQVNRIKDYKMRIEKLAEIQRTLIKKIKEKNEFIGHLEKESKNKGADLCYLQSLRSNFQIEQQKVKKLEEKLDLQKFDMENTKKIILKIKIEMKEKFESQSFYANFKRCNEKIETALKNIKQINQNNCLKENITRDLQSKCKEKINKITESSKILIKQAKDLIISSKSLFDNQKQKQIGNADAILEKINKYTEEQELFVRDLKQSNQIQNTEIVLLKTKLNENQKIVKDHILLLVNSIFPKFKNELISKQTNIQLKITNGTNQIISHIEAFNKKLNKDIKQKLACFYQININTFTEIWNKVSTIELSKIINLYEKLKSKVKFSKFHSEDYEQLKLSYKNLEICLEEEKQSNRERAAKIADYESKEKTEQIEYQNLMDAASSEADKHKEVVNKIKEDSNEELNKKNRELLIVQQDLQLRIEEIEKMKMELEMQEDTYQEKLEELKSSTELDKAKIKEHADEIKHLKSNASLYKLTMEMIKNKMLLIKRGNTENIKEVSEFFEEINKNISETISCTFSYTKQIKLKIANFQDQLASSERENKNIMIKNEKEKMANKEDDLNAYEKKFVKQDESKNTKEGLLNQFEINENDEEINKLQESIANQEKIIREKESVLTEYKINAEVNEQRIVEYTKSIENLNSSLSKRNEQYKNLVSANKDLSEKILFLQMDVEDKKERRISGQASSPNSDIGKKVPSRPDEEEVVFSAKEKYRSGSNTSDRNNSVSSIGTCPLPPSVKMSPGKKLEEPDIKKIKACCLKIIEFLPLQ